MVLEAIYIVRHGYRSNWAVNSITGEYSSSLRNPTGIPSDPALASYGVEQARELAEKLVTLDPAVDAIYSSPWYRCLQTLKPTVDRLRADNRTRDVKVRCENGLGEFFGQAHFDHPSPATLPVLQQHFCFINPSHTPCIIPSVSGETIPMLHNRLAYTLHHLISLLDADPSAPRSLLICSHAASMIAMGRVLTGNMPSDPNEEDFRCGTCSLSIYRRRKSSISNSSAKLVEKWDSKRPEEIPDIEWTQGRGVGGGWDCEANGDCSFLKGGEERSWKFSGDEAFLKDPNGYNDKVNEGKGSRL